LKGYDAHFVIKHFQRKYLEKRNTYHFKSETCVL